MSRSCDFSAVGSNHLVWVCHEEWKGDADKGEHDEADLKAGTCQYFELLASSVHTYIGAIAD